MAPLRHIKQKSSHLILAILNLGSQPAYSQKRERGSSGGNSAFPRLLFQDGMNCLPVAPLGHCVFFFCFTISSCPSIKQGRKYLEFKEGEEKSLSDLCECCGCGQSESVLLFPNCFSFTTFQLLSVLLQPHLTHRKQRWKWPMTLEVLLLVLFRRSDQLIIIVSFGFKNCWRNPNPTEVNSKTSTGFDMAKTSP